MADKNGKGNTSLIVWEASEIEKISITLLFFQSWIAEVLENEDSTLSSTLM